ncbi:exopolysaccharide biosynthesis protein [Rhizobium sp. SSA_523]|uniref:exopolysaccharide biosynthesis protein n=1 Tax=Rhizobium sp. SSA_523 TaxID=2952477 RepID=UPI00209113F3|nr:exopolysaccharide biosynthesis protein [Rhizobium sp. SSA_523]MCO5734026.1 exopolysaccharide biosynthesis protein [Rhizobium sp. SSA_523]WKC24667.1 exopolysaccharide biosynthesis protein [Rhizobium sp. SSA_523]
MSEVHEFDDTSRSLSETLKDLIDGIEGDTITLRDLMEEVGEQGLLLLCALASLPFLIPVSIPGVSTVFGAAIILVSLAIALNRLPWLPKKILDRNLDTAKLVPALTKGSRIVSKIDRYLKPRLSALTATAFVNRLNALGITAGGVLLLFPLGLVPFSNTLPAIAILLLATGMMQRDGLMILGGYLFLIITLVYFTVLGIIATSAGRGLASVFGG